MSVFWLDDPVTQSRGSSKAQTLQPSSMHPRTRAPPLPPTAPRFRQPATGNRLPAASRPACDFQDKIREEPWRWHFAFRPSVDGSRRMQNVDGGVTHVRVVIINRTRTVFEDARTACSPCATFEPPMAQTADTGSVEDLWSIAYLMTVASSSHSLCLGRSGFQ